MSDSKNTVRVSSFGRFFTRLNKMTYGSDGGGGYKLFTHRRSKYRAHRIIAYAFHGPPPSSLHTVDHIDGNTSNNHSSNLRWATPAEQIAYSYARSDRRNGGLALGKTVISTRIDTNENKTFQSITEAANALNIAGSSISAICHGKRKTSHGFTFKFVQNESECDTGDEQWYPISVDGSNTNCYVSNLGHIRRNDTLISGYTNKNGYVIITVRRRKLRVHRLVAFAFLPPAPSDNCTIDHINGIKTDNRAANLRWATPSEQTLNAIANGRKSSAEARSKAVEYRKIGTTQWISALSAVAVAELLCLHPSSLTAALRNASYSFGGYAFRYVPEPDLPGEEWREFDMTLLNDLDSKESDEEAIAECVVQKRAESTTKTLPEKLRSCGVRGCAEYFHDLWTLLNHELCVHNHWRFE